MKPRLGIWLALVAVLGAGCGGISATKSVSPLDFFLPGLMQNDPAPPTPPLSTNAPVEFAQASTSVPTLASPCQPRP